MLHALLLTASLTQTVGVPTNCEPNSPAAALVRAVAEGIVNADNARDIDRVRSFYAVDAVLMPPDEAPVQGWASIQPRYVAMFAAYTPAIAGQINEICVSGSMALVRGRNTGRLESKDTAKSRDLNDEYVMSLRLDADGAWRIAHLIWHRVTPSPESWWITYADPLQSWATILGVAVGAVWAVYHFYLSRESETALALDLKYSTDPYGDNNFLVSFDACLENKGKVKLMAEQGRPAFDDSDECLKFPINLMLRKVDTTVAVGQQIRWFVDGGLKLPLDTDREIDLAQEYETRETVGGAVIRKTEFWLEPGESYHMTANVVLEPTRYLAMVTFVGSGDSREFWRRVFIVHVPQKPPSEAIVDSAGPGHF